MIRTRFKHCNACRCEINSGIAYRAPENNNCFICASCKANYYVLTEHVHTCRHCGVQQTCWSNSKLARQPFCTRLCRARYQAMTTKNKRRMQRCDGCGTMIKPERRNQKHCSPECRRRAYRKKHEKPKALVLA